MTQPSSHPVSIFALLSLLKGIVFSTVVIGVAGDALTFWQQLILVATSAMLTGLFLLANSYINTKRVEKHVDEGHADLGRKVDDVHHDVTDLKEAQGIAKRKSDHSPGKR